MRSWAATHHTPMSAPPHPTHPPAHPPTPTCLAAGSLPGSARGRAAHQRAGLGPAARHALPALVCSPAGRPAAGHQGGAAGPELQRRHRQLGGRRGAVPGAHTPGAAGALGTAGAGALASVVCVDCVCACACVCVCVCDGGVQCGGSVAAAHAGRATRPARRRWPPCTEPSATCARWRARWRQTPPGSRPTGSSTTGGWRLAGLRRCATSGGLQRVRCSQGWLPAAHALVALVVGPGSAVVVRHLRPLPRVAVRSLPAGGARETARRPKWVGAASTTSRSEAGPALLCRPCKSLTRRPRQGRSRRQAVARRLGVAARRRRRGLRQPRRAKLLLLQRWQLRR